MIRNESFRDKLMLSQKGDSLPEELKKEIKMLFEIAQSSVNKGEFEQAIHIYNKILKLNEQSSSAWIALGHCYSVTEDHYKALTSYEQALKLSPQSQVEPNF